MSHSPPPHTPAQLPKPRPLSPIARVVNLPFIGAILLYRVTLSPFIGGQCRFEPTCSRYGLEAYRLHGPIRGTGLTISRILRCHPFNKGGYDAVPWPGSAEPADGDSHKGDAPAQTRLVENLYRDASRHPDGPTDQEQR